ncbi:MAG: hypothetical protein ACREP8_11260, partial [Candidatus Binatia bacterium]
METLQAGNGWADLSLPPVIQGYQARFRQAVELFNHPHMRNALQAVLGSGDRARRRRVREALHRMQDLRETLREIVETAERLDDFHQDEVDFRERLAELLTRIRAQDEQAYQRLRAVPRNQPEYSRLRNFYKAHPNHDISEDMLSVLQIYQRMLDAQEDRFWLADAAADLGPRIEAVNSTLEELGIPIAAPAAVDAEANRSIAAPAAPAPATVVPLRRTTTRRPPRRRGIAVPVELDGLKPPPVPSEFQEAGNDLLEAARSEGSVVEAGTRLPRDTEEAPLDSLVAALVAGEETGSEVSISNETEAGERPSTPTEVWIRRLGHLLG